jgi:hypothetical protein
MNNAISQNCNGKEFVLVNVLSMLSKVGGDSRKYHAQPTWKIRTLMKPDTIALTISHFESFLLAIQVVGFCANALTVLSGFDIGCRIHSPFSANPGEKRFHLPAL